MIKLRFFLQLYVLFSGVQALNEAVPYELLYFYSAYKMEFAALPHARTIATGYTHTQSNFPAAIAFDTAALLAGVPGICTFDEFVKEVGSTTLKYYKYTNAGRSLTPNPDDIAAKIANRQKGDTGPLLYWPSKLLPSAGFPVPGPTTKIMEIPLPDILQPILDAVQRSRTAAAAAGGSLKTFVDSCVTDSKNYLRITNQYRLGDQGKYLIPASKDSAEAKPFEDYLTMKSVPILNVDGVTPIKTEALYPEGTYQAIDWDITFTKAGTSVTDTQKTAMLNFIRTYGTLTSTAAEVKAKVHQDVISMNQFAIDLIHSANLACVTKRKRGMRARKGSRLAFRGY